MLDISPTAPKLGGDLSSQLAPGINLRSQSYVYFRTCRKGLEVASRVLRYVACRFQIGLRETRNAYQGSRCATRARRWLGPVVAALAGRCDRRMESPLRLCGGISMNSVEQCHDPVSWNADQRLVGVQENLRAGREKSSREVRNLQNDGGIFVWFVTKTIETTTVVLGLIIAVQRNRPSFCLCHERSSFHLQIIFPLPLCTISLSEPC